VTSHTASIGAPAKRPLRKTVKLLLLAGSLGGALFVALIACRIFGLLCPYLIPSSSMAPTLMPGDHVLMENFSYLSASPQRGDVVVFDTRGIEQIKQASVFTMRLVGLPGEHVQFSNNSLIIDGKPVVLNNEAGPISYPPLNPHAARWATVDVQVPPGHYFVAGDNSGNSLDSRFWGPLAADKILGRLCLYYWPPARIGVIR
jgi:signal peptidase I